MKIADLSPETRDKLSKYYYDRFIEKHEGPFCWESVFQYYDPEFMQINEHHVLLPIAQTRHSNITILRCIESNDGQTLTIFLQDMSTSIDPELTMFETGFVAICDKFPGEDFFLGIFYHEWIIVENDV